MLRNRRVLWSLGLFVAVGCGGSPPPTSEPVVQSEEPDTIVDPFAESAPPPEPAGPTADELTELASNAYVYGYPLVYNIDEMTRITSRPGEIIGAAPVNILGGGRQLAGPRDEFVSINNDSLYSMAVVDLREQPLVFHVPRVRDRYYVFQFVDAWTNNFAYVGTRATGSDEQWYFLVPPGYEGEVPEGPTVIQAPSSIITLVGRYSTTGTSRDVRAVGRLQRETYLAPLGEHRRAPSTSGRDFGDHVLATPAEGVDESLLFWEKFRAYMQLAPPPAHEAEYLAAFESLGVLAEESPYLEPDAQLREILIAGAERGKAKIEAAMAGGGNPLPSGWSQTVHAFDYNIDYFGVGTIDAPEWKMEDNETRYFMRALAARVGLWGNHGYEAVYTMTFVDADGQTLDGANSYEFTLTSPPPVDAFWSITMYGVPDFYLVDNPLNRYSVGDRTPGLRRNRDGSLTVYISHEAPADRRQRANWLPAPEGSFRPILRMYMPRAEILDGSYAVPPIRRVGGEAVAAPAESPRPPDAPVTE